MIKLIASTTIAGIGIPVSPAHECASAQPAAEL
jgi:hypothetical protein